MTNGHNAQTDPSIQFDPIALGNFKRTYWPDKLLVGHGGLIGVGDLVSNKAELQDVSALLGAHWGQVKIISRQPELFSEEIVSSYDAAEHYKLGKTICIVHVHRSIPSVEKCVALLANALEVPSSLVHCSAYASPEGLGTPKHFDNHEVLIVQLSGEKQWWVAPNHNVTYPTRNYVAGTSPYAELPYSLFDVPVEMPADSIAVKMTAGSVLFIPRGMWHATTATTASLSLSFGFAVPTPLDRLLAVIKTELASYSALCKPISGVGGDTEFLQLANHVASSVKDCLKESIPRNPAFGPGNKYE